MHRRLIKELRPLLLPGLIAALAAITPLLLSPFRSGGTDEFLFFVAGLASFAFVITTTLVACQPFGTEIHERTFPLLLTQPIGRSRLWIEKLLPALIMVVALGLVRSWSNRHDWSFAGWQMDVLAGWRLDRQPELLIEAFSLMTICASGFWTLIARSTMGGVAFTLASQLMLTLGLSYVGAFSSKTASRAILTIPMVYAAVFVWLGWRKFASLELRHGSFGESAAPDLTRPPGRWWSSWLRCQPRGYLTNLVRKELRLQKPVLMIAGLISLCWLVALGLCVLTPTQKEFYQGLGNVLTGAFMVLVPLLAGCISLGDEKALGLNAWQLTLPVSARKQWLVKLAVGAGVAIALGLVLPYVLAWMSSFEMETGLAQVLRDSHRQEPLLASLTVVGFPFLLSFLAATLMANTVRSALAAIAGFMLLFLSAVLGIWCAEKAGGMEGPLLKFVIAHFQLTGVSVQRPLSELVTVAGYSSVTLGIVILLALSFAQFRRARVQGRVVVCYTAIVAAYTFLAAFWVVDIQMSNAEAWRELKTNVAEALQSLPRSNLKPEAVSVGELESTGQLSSAAKAWLRGATITIQLGEARTFSSHLNDQGTPRVVNNPMLAVIRFPDGRQEFVGPYGSFSRWNLQ